MMELFEICPKTQFDGFRTGGEQGNFWQKSVNDGAKWKHPLLKAWENDFFFYISPLFRPHKKLACSSTYKFLVLIV